MSDKSAGPGDEIPPEEAARPDDVSAPVGGRKEIGGRAGKDPTRYGDWEKNGRCIDF